MSSLAIGDVLDDRYRIDRPIARGGMSTVYRCVDMRLGRSVAAKVMHEHLAEDPQFVQRFTREARGMAQLTHPNLVSIHDFSAGGQPIFLVMELITGGTLRELLAERGPMPPHAATAVMRAVLSGLSVIHARGLVHRDIKPDNVLIDSDNRVKLGDFGLIRAAAQAGTGNQIIGTVSYLSPEQVTGDNITAASDVYSAGVVLYELLTTETPFKGDSPLDHAKARLHQDVAAPSSRVEGVPPLFDALVGSATARDPQQRFADAAEFLAALDDVAAELELPAFVVPVPKNSAAARTAAQPTNFTGINHDPVFDATREFPAVEDEQAPPTRSESASASSTKVSPPSPPERHKETLFDHGQTRQDNPETLYDQPGRLSFHHPDSPRQVPAPSYPGPQARPQVPGQVPAQARSQVPGQVPGQARSQVPGQVPQQHMPPAAPAAAPLPARVPGQLAGGHPGGQVPALGMSHTVEPHRPRQVLSNRSPVVFVLWLLAVLALAAALAIGGLSLGSGVYF
ncbi:hypothetical protein CPHO_04160 [Corynebacterium phocae]|uniref:non-specific serine/threonine protein kinase n=1 Tax=Corynebacterium phocae TaxID=161895 RepID=A0A1L7D240_9CORY|nr:protein kinase [Corynebacterium phocae]APT92215.1 hypothetical protein CPHO_04160 [Corynebacterium phocae]